jgi:hypothetical protein
MSTEQFTPGPWRHTSYDGWDAVEDGHRELLCKLVANNPANATLMSAAPELFAALKAVVLAEFGNLEHPSISGSRLWKNARAALQKAGAQ